VGKVRIAAVKKVSRELVSRYPDKFSKNYEENKVALSTLVDARTKRLRNRIVGYVTRLKIVEAKRAAAPGEIGPEGADDQA
jgi:small subunit ribosomal protein S17e